MPTLSIYTDGSAYPNPGQGGWAAIIVLPPEFELILRGSEEATTNNRMEFQAPLSALDWMVRMGYTRATIFSDSQLVVNTMNAWAWGWERKGWKPKKNKEIKNLDLIQPLHELRKKLEIQWTWVRGHNGHHWNEMADRHAEEARAKRIRHVITKH